MFMWFGYNTLIIFFSFYLLCELFLHEMLRKTVYRQWVPCGRNSFFSFFFTDGFETLQMFFAWNGDVHVVWI